MKQKSYLITLLVFLAVALLSCESDDTTPDSDVSSAYEFVSMHLDEDSGERPYFSLLNIDNGELEFTHLTDVYPIMQASNFHTWKQTFYQANGILGFTLHKELSETVTNNYGEELTVWTGVWMDLRDGEVHELPTLNACTDFGYDPGCSRYSFTQRNSVRIGESGHVFYVAMSAYHSGGWHDEPRYRLIRLDRQTGEYEVSPLISSWTLSQPEINPNTYGLARIGERIFPSACGRYVYGRTVGWGISGGNLIASDAIMFRYDFNTEEFSRVEEVPYGYSMRYSTADNRYFIYYYNGNNYRYDTQTGQSTQLMQGIGTYSFQTNANNYGVIDDPFPMNILAVRNVVADDYVDIPIPRQARRPMFTSDGKQAYFRYHNCDMNYLLRISDLTLDATVDTVAILPPGVRVMTIY